MSNIVIENARIAFRNFSGEAGKFNPAGRRNFCVFLEDEVAKTIEKDGWNVRYLQPKDKDETPTPYIQVSVNYENVPPKIIIISSKGKTLLNESTVNILDWAEIDNVDLIIKPYKWEVSGKKGIKAYLKTMYVTIVEDVLERKYSNAPDSGSDMIGGCGNCETCDGNCGCGHEH